MVKIGFKYNQAPVILTMMPAIRSLRFALILSVFNCHIVYPYQIVKPINGYNAGQMNYMPQQTEESAAENLNSPASLTPATTNMLPINSQACRDGYVAAPGDVDGATLGRFYDIGSTDECAKICDQTTSCCSYEWSPSKRHCNMNRECEPNLPKYEDYQLCIQKKPLKVSNEQSEPMVKGYNAGQMSYMPQQTAESATENLNSPASLTPATTNTSPSNSQACRDGYVAAPGDVDGATLGRFYDIASTDDCAKICDQIASCCSYEWSPSRRHCNINRECEPNLPKYEDYQLCIQRKPLKACRDGYVASPGDVAGRSVVVKKVSLPLYHIVAKLGSLYDIASTDDCAKNCDQIASCCSYEWSPSRRQCNTIRECEPNLPKYEDYQLCIPMKPLRENTTTCSCHANWWTYPEDNCCRDESTIKTRKPGCDTILLNCKILIDTDQNYELSLCCPKPRESTASCSCNANWWTYPEDNCCRDEFTIYKARNQGCRLIKIDCEILTDSPHYRHSLCCPNPLGERSDLITGEPVPGEPSNTGELFTVEPQTTIGLTTLGVTTPAQPTTPKDPCDDVSTTCQLSDCNLAHMKFSVCPKTCGVTKLPSGYPCGVHTRLTRYN